jgi:hypothetical protein
MPVTTMRLTCLQAARLIRSSNPDAPAVLLIGRYWVAGGE